MSEVAAVIVTYNRKEKLRRCIDAVLSQNSKLKPDVFIVDNGSTDGTEDLIREIIVQSSDDERNKIIYTNMHHNSGGAGGFCYGVRRTVEEGYSYLWLMDDDSIPSDTALEEFIRYNETHKGEFGFLSGKVLWTDGSLCRMNIPRETMYSNVKDWSRSVIPISMASFISLFLPADIVKKVGLPIKEFFIWTDDWEYTRRISRNYPCYLITGSTVTHYCESPEGAKLATVESERIGRFRYMYRNDVYLYRREGIKGFCYEFIRLNVHALRVLFCGHTIREKVKRIGIMIKGTVEGLRFSPSPDYPCVEDKDSVN